jgi:hypothetical protein
LWPAFTPSFLASGVREYPAGIGAFLSATASSTSQRDETSGGSGHLANGTYQAVDPPHPVAELPLVLVAIIVLTITPDV